jgi:mono/diheme cytochrome c family protein
MRLRKLAALLGGICCVAVAPVFGQTNQSPAPVQRPVPIPAPRPVSAPWPAARIIPAPVNNPYTPPYPTLVFDSESKQYDARPGERVAPFVFNLTNVWTNEIRIDQVHPSCGCTTAKLPPTPWHIPPGGTGQVQAEVNLTGKPPGLTTKMLTFYTSVGNRIVTLKVNIPRASTTPVALTADQRKEAMAQAASDAHAIFRGDCAKCHVDKGAKSYGQDLYAADCGICHESSHRDTAVPDLHALKHPTDLDYWKAIITFGKPHTMMPGFAITQGGPLNDAQINSLASYLNRTISHNFSTPAMTNAANSPLPPDRELVR